MRERLVIRLGRDPARDPAEWRVIDDAGIPIGPPGAGPLTEATSKAHGRRTIVLVPGTDLLLQQARIPKTSRQKQLQALPFALEEGLADDPDALHFAPAGTRVNGHLDTAIVERARMDRWVGALGEAGIHPEWMTADTELLPRASCDWQIFVDGDEAWASAAGQRFRIETDALPAVLRAKLDRAGEARPEAIRVVRYREGVLSLPDAIGGTPVVAETRPVTEPLFETLVRGLDERNTINLLQGPYSRREQWSRRLKPWWPAIGLTLAWAVVHLAGFAVERHRLATQVSALNEEVANLYRTAFPETRNLVNPRAQMEQQLKTLRANADGGGGMLDLLATAGRAIKATPGIELGGVHYRSQDLSIEVTSPDVSALDRLKLAIGSEPDIEVELQSANAGQGKVSGRLVIKRKGGA